MTSLLIGVAAAIAAVILEATVLILGEIAGNVPAGSVGPAIVVVLAVIEEGVKFVLIRKRSGDTPSRLTAVVSASMLGTGFGLTEAVLVHSAIPDAAVSAIAGVVAIHIASSALYGSVSGLPKLVRASALPVGVAIHSLYNLAVIASGA